MFRNYLVVFYYTNLNENKEIKILEIDQSKYNTYQDILNLNNFRNRPSFIYFNTRFDFNRLENDVPILKEIYNQTGEKKLNLIFIANGLVDGTEEKKKWIIKINELELKGTHISLTDSYKDFESYFKETYSGEIRTTHIPHYLLANRNGIITDTIFERDIDIEKVMELIK